jgi:hypothetical protein
MIALCSGTVLAQPNKKVDIEDLRDAIAAADKRGENVSTIREKFTAFEKALAKGFTAGPPGAPAPTPAELAELRDAVEMAAKKGENVEPIAKELGAIERAIVGREFERPKPPVPEPMRPLPVPPRRGGFVIGGNGPVVIGSGAGGFNATSVVISGGTFTIKARKGDVSFTVTGTADPSIAPTITIVDGDKKTETDDLKKVPEEHRGSVERLLKMIGR